MAERETARRRRAVFLDRDGVLNRALVQNERPYPPRHAAELELLPGVVDACAALRDAGFLLVVVTNQPDIARGEQTREAVDELNRALRAAVAVDDLVVCPHDDADACTCRKPLPGMLVDAAARWGVELAESYMVGDRWRDVEAGRRAGCRTVFINRGYREPAPERPDATVRDLPEAAELILARERVAAR